LLGRIGKRFAGVQVCPMIPIIRENCEGSILHELMMLAYWIAKVYAGNRAGLINSWTHFLGWASQSTVNPDLRHWTHRLL